MEYHYLGTEEREMGPVSWSELEGLRRAGVISDDTMVASEGWTEWKRFGDFLARPKKRDPFKIWATGLLLLLSFWILLAWNRAHSQRQRRMVAESLVGEQINRLRAAVETGTTFSDYRAVVVEAEAVLASRKGSLSIKFRIAAEAAVLHFHNALDIWADHTRASSGEIFNVPIRFSEAPDSEVSMVTEHYRDRTIAFTTPKGGTGLGYTPVSIRKAAWEKAFESMAEIDALQAPPLDSIRASAARQESAFDIEARAWAAARRRVSVLETLQHSLDTATEDNLPALLKDFEKSKLLD